MSRRFLVRTLALTLAPVTALHATPSMALRPDSVAADTTQLPLTADVLGRLSTFWTAFLQQPDSIRTVARKANHESLPISVDEVPAAGHRSVELPSVVNMVAMAGKYPTVAAALKQVDLTPAQWEQYRRSLFTAMFTDQLEKAAGEAAGGTTSTSAYPSVVLRNVAFLRTHQKELDALKASQMWFPPLALGVPLKVGSTAPQFEVHRWVNAPAGGPRTTFGDGHVYVLDVTAHWCGPCRQVYPVLGTLQHRFAAKGVRVLYATRFFGYYGETEGLSPAAELDSLKHYVAEHKIIAPMAVSDKADLLAGYYGGEDGLNFPRVVVIDGAGKVRAIHSGWSDDLSSQLDDEVTAALTAKAP